MRGRQRRGPEGPSVIQLAAALLQVFPGLPPDLPGERPDSFGVWWNKAKALQRVHGVAVKRDARAELPREPGFPPPEPSPRLGPRRCRLRIYLPLAASGEGLTPSSASPPGPFIRRNLNLDRQVSASIHPCSHSILRVAVYSFREPSSRPAILPANMEAR